MPYLASAGQILVTFVFGVLIAIVVARVLLQLVRANFYNPICQFLYKLTNPLLIPLHRVVPNWRNLDIAGVLLAWLLCALEWFLLLALAGRVPGMAGLALVALGELVDFVLVFLFAVILVRALLSFLTVNRANPVVPLLYQISEPVLRPLRRLIPALGAIDLSPAIAGLVLMLARVLVAMPLRDFGLQLVMAP